MDYCIILYFFAGILQDFLLTLNWRYIASQKLVPAALTSFIVSIVGLMVLYNIIVHLNEKRGVLAIIVYAAGVATGTILAMKFKAGFAQRRKKPCP